MRERIFIFIAFLLAAGESFTQVRNIVITREDSVVITSSHHVGFPKIIRLPDDSLLITYRKGNSHVDMSGKLVKKRGAPNGLSWGAEQVLYDDSLFDERHGCVSWLPDGSILLTFYKYSLPNHFAVPPLPAFFSLFASRSYDYGNTFSIPVSIDNSPLALPPGWQYDGNRYLDSIGTPLESFAGCSNAQIVNGIITVPAYGGETPVYQVSQSCFSTAQQRIVFFESTDAVSWSRRYINETELPEIWLTEPSVSQLSTNDIIMHFRSSNDTCTPGGWGPLRQARSTNGGSSFSDYSEFDFVGQAPSLYRLSNDILLSGFRYYNDSMTVQRTAFVYSLDEGQTWSDTILTDKCISDCGYPDFVELANNKFMLIYYGTLGYSIKGVVYSFDIITLSEEDINDRIFSSVAMFPNPAAERFFIQFDSPVSHDAIISVTKITGENVYSRAITASAGTNKIEVHTENIAAGYYLVGLQNETKKIVKPLVIY